MSTSFDAYAETYERDLNNGLSVSGESRDFFLQGRVRWLRGRMAEKALRADRVLDYGCGTGAAVRVLRDGLGALEVVGVDTSVEELAVARRQNPGVEFHPVGEHVPAGDFDLVYCNGVFHHIPPPERPAAVRRIGESLKPGGLFALFENNPWNPGTRYIMSRIPFDRDAITLPPPESRALMQGAGFTVLRTDFLFFFPRLLRALRPLESRLSGVPLGAQYLVLGQR
jgi:SAM-dependent methyltransferase